MLGNVIWNMLLNPIKVWLFMNVCTGLMLGTVCSSHFPEIRDRVKQLFLTFANIYEFES